MTDTLKVDQFWLDLWELEEILREINALVEPESEGRP